MAQRRRHKCPDCGPLSRNSCVVSNGHYPTNAGRKVRFVCRSCGHRWSVLEPTQPKLPFYSENRFRTPPERVLKALALYVYGFSLTAVTKLVGIRSETVRKHFRVYAEHRAPKWPTCGARDKAAWDRIAAILERKYSIPYPKIEESKEMLLGLHAKLVPPREHGQDYLKKIRDRSKRQQFERKARAITGLKIEIRQDGKIIRAVSRKLVAAP
jgi:transposase-like protein